MQLCALFMATFGDGPRVSSEQHRIIMFFAPVQHVVVRGSAFALTSFTTLRSWIVLRVSTSVWPGRCIPPSAPRNPRILLHQFRTDHPWSGMVHRQPLLGPGGRCLGVRGRRVPLCPPLRRLLPSGLVLEGKCFWDRDPDSVGPSRSPDPWAEAPPLPWIRGSTRTPL